MESLHENSPLFLWALSWVDLDLVRLRAHPWINAHQHGVALHAEPLPRILPVKGVSREEIERVARRRDEIPAAMWASYQTELRARGQLFVITINRSITVTV